MDKVFVKENEAVKKGDALLRLSSPEETAQLAASETEWRDTQIEVKIQSNPFLVTLLPALEKYLPD